VNLELKPWRSSGWFLLTVYVIVLSCNLYIIQEFFRGTQWSHKFLRSNSLVNQINLVSTSTSTSLSKDSSNLYILIFFHPSSQCRSVKLLSYYSLELNYFLIIPLIHWLPFVVTPKKISVFVRP
jgi:hypothetical protein